MDAKRAFMALARADERLDDNDDGAVQDKFAARPGRGEPAPAPLSLDIETRVVIRFTCYDFGNEVVDYWVGSAGLPFAIRVLARSLEKRDGFLRLDDGWRRLRQRLAVAEETDYAAALETARELRARAALPTRAALSYCFPTEEKWANADMKSCLDEERASYHELLFASATDPKLVAAALERESPYYPPIDFLPSLVETFGPKVVPLLAGLLQRSKRTREIAAVLSIIPGDEAMATLVKRLGEKAMMPALSEMVAHSPNSAKRLLSPAAAGQGKAADAARSLLAGLK